MKYIEIIKANISGSETNAVLLRDLYKTLEVKSEFANWIKAQKEILSEYIEGEDYIRTTQDSNNTTVIVKVGLNLKGKQSEYVISLDMAKHLCMLSRTKKGREARQYFINIEKQENKQSNLQLDIQMQRLDALTNVAHATKESIDNHSHRIENLERNTRLEAWQEKALLDAKNKKVYELGGDDKKLTNPMHRKVWSLFKKRFHLPRYNELKSGQYENGLEFIDSLTLSDMVA